MSDSKTIKLERIIDAPREIVWDALTDINILKKWQPFFNEFEPKEHFKTSFWLGREEGKKYLHICEVTEVVKERRLTYSWHYEGYPGDSYVTFELSSVEGDKTRVGLTHVITEPFPSDSHDFAHRNFVEGWTNIINALKDFMEKK